nr:MULTISPECIES: glycosyltransferase family 2 protein [Sphingomonas]
MNQVDSHAAFRRRLIPSPERPLQLAVIVPVLNEAANITPLIAQLERALTNLVWEIVVVDDNSPDGTADVARDRGVIDPRVRIVQRVGRRGLSSAVVEGMLATSAPVLAVMDGDLQHDEAILPKMYEIVARGGYDLAIGTRYAGEGSTGNWSASRARISNFATKLSKRLLKADVSDPMSGFFMIRRTPMMAALPHLSTIGFKILMDLVASSPRPLRIAEVPYTFRERLHGDSKFDLKAAQEFGVLLLDKLVGHLVPVRLLLFALVGASGVLVHLAVLGSCLWSGASFRAAQIAAVVVAMTGNFLINNLITFRDRRLRGMRFWRGLLTFYAVGAIGAVANVGIGTVVYRLDGIWWLGGLAGVAVGLVWNYAASSALTWRKS